MKKVVLHMHMIHLMMHVERGEHIHFEIHLNHVNDCDKDGCPEKKKPHRGDEVKTLPPWPPS